MYGLVGKVAFITGAASGVGEGVVRLLVEEGVKHVAVLDISEAAGTALQDDLNGKHGAGKVQFHSCDVTDEEQLLGIMAAVKREHGYIDLVINNAGIMNDSLQTYKKEIMINVVALVTGSIRALELMRRDEGGRGGTIINISSVAALCQYPGLPVYWATKSAVLQFSNCLGMDDYYSRTDVRVLTVCFGATDTALLSEAKVGTFDRELNAQVLETMKMANSQRMESAAAGVIAAYKLGASGSTWLATRDEPAKDITDDVKRAYDVLRVHTTIETTLLPQHVALLDIDETVGVAFEKELNAEYGSGASRFHRCDVTDDEQLTAALRAAAGHGGLDVVVNNAGLMNDAPDVYKKEIEINVTALITSTLKALELMRKDDGGKGGTVINISSVAGLCQMSMMPIYWATKAAVIQFSNCIGIEDYFEKTGVRVIAVCIGATATALITPQKLGSLDKRSDGQAIADIVNDYHIQRMESAAQGVIDAYKKGTSGSTWVASRDLPAVDITSNVRRAYEIMAEHN